MDNNWSSLSSQHYAFHRTILSFKSPFTWILRIIIINFVSVLESILIHSLHSFSCSSQTLSSWISHSSTSSSFVIFPFVSTLSTAVHVILFFSIFSVSSYSFWWKRKEVMTAILAGWTFHTSLCSFFPVSPSYRSILKLWWSEAWVSSFMVTQLSPCVLSVSHFSLEFFCFLFIIILLWCKKAFISLRLRLLWNYGFTSITFGGLICLSLVMKFVSRISQPLCSSARDLCWLPRIVNKPMIRFLSLNDSWYGKRMKILQWEEVWSRIKESVRLREMSGKKGITQRGMKGKKQHHDFLVRFAPFVLLFFKEWMIRSINWRIQCKQ